MTTTTQPLLNDQLADDLRALRGDPTLAPHASIVIPVNAQGDIGNVCRIIGDVTKYEGTNTAELILVVNNYSEGNEPAEIEKLKAFNIRVIAIPNVRRPGEAVGFSARIPGILAAESEPCILFDADCRIPHITQLLDWYVQQFDAGVGAAYTRVDYYDYEPHLSLTLRFALHHLSRWCKRNVMRIPTTRGSNYAVRRSVMLELYERKMLADEMNVGPAFKHQGHQVAYDGHKTLRVLTSGRMFSAGWLRMIPYFWYRLKYNLRTLPVRVGVAKHTGRENDPVREYVDNRPVR
jgi:hypothetical protein